jgi:crossover junction endodeoxyribonuclease RuvC
MGTVKSITIFGVDPGTRSLGFGWIEIDAAQPESVLSRGYGVVQPEGKLSVAERLSILMAELTDVFAERRPQVVVVEKVFMAKNVESAFVLGQARGVVLAVAAATGAVIQEEAAKTAKKSVTGRGSAEKAEVRMMLGRLLGMSEELERLPLDASDALALAYQGWRTYVVGAAMKRTPIEREVNERAGKKNEVAT